MGAVILSSIGARRRHSDPLPYAHFVTGERRAALGPLELSDYSRMREWAYVPRAEYMPAQSNRTNPILDLSRDDDWSDTWGTALSWFFPAAAIVEYVGAAPIPPEWGYRASMAGAASDLTEGSYAATECLVALGLGFVVELEDQEPVVELYPLETLDDDVLDFAEACALHAGRVFHRLLELVPESDRY